MNGNKAKPLYPVESSFVIALHRDCEAFPDRCAGRVEHMASGRSATFREMADLIGFISRELSHVEGNSHPP